MTNRNERFLADVSDGITFAAGESADARAAAFLAPFMASQQVQKGGVFVDADGHPLAVSPSWIEGLERYAASELGRAARAIVDPSEIRLGWVRGADGGEILARRYLASVDGEDIAVEVSRAGWRFATSRDPNYKLRPLQIGTIAWAKP